MKLDELRGGGPTARRVTCAAMPPRPCSRRESVGRLMLVGEQPGDKEDLLATRS